MDIEWGFLSLPEWFDHNCNLYFQWHHNRIPFWKERVVFALLAMEQDCNVLELCCGDGFNAFHFYSARAARILSVDFDPVAIDHAMKYNQASNIHYR